MNKKESQIEVQNIINSIKFYIMLGIVCSQSESFAGDSQKQLNNFIQELRKDIQYSKEKIDRYCKIACESLPSEFLSLYHIDLIQRR